MRLEGLVDRLTRALENAGEVNKGMRSQMDGKSDIDDNNNSFIAASPEAAHSFTAASPEAAQTAGSASLEALNDSSHSDCEEMGPMWMTSHEVSFDGVRPTYSEVETEVETQYEDAETAKLV